MEITLDVQPRTEKGKGPARRYRAAGMVPAVFYGASVEPVALLVDAKQMNQALHTDAGGNVLINLKVDGKSRLTIPREIQRHPIRGTILHVDFVNVARDQKISAQVPVHLVGESHGVKEGGVLDQHLHELHIEAMPSDIPDSVELDVSGLGIGDALHVSDVKIAQGVEIITLEDELVVAVTEARLAAESDEVTEAAAESADEVPSDDDTGGSEES
jgi:large subunit ribosomal protein L25